MAYADEVLADSPLVYWRLGESSGTSAVDASGNGRHGTYAGPTLGATGLLAGDLDTAASFDGSNDMVSIAYDSSWMAPAAFTAEAWFKPSRVTGHNQIIGHVNYLVITSANYSFHVRWSDATLHVGIGTSVGNYTEVTVPSVTIAVGVTYHVAMTWDGTTVRVYLDGSEVHSFSKSGTLWNGSGAAFGVGKNAANNTAPAGGVIDEAAFYGTALSGARIAAHYAAGTAASSWSGSFAVELPPLSVEFSGTVTEPPVTGSFAVDLPSLAVEFSGTYTSPPVTGSFNVTLPSLAVEFSGAYHDADVTGSFSVELPAPLVEFSGTYVPPPVTGSFAVTISPLAVDFTGSIVGDDTVTGSFAVDLPSLLVSFTGTYTGAVGGDVSNAADGLIITGSAVVSWTPAIVEPPTGGPGTGGSGGTAAVGEVYDIAQAFSPVTINGATPSFETVEKKAKRYRQRVVIGGKDVSFFRGYPAEIGDYQLLEPFLYGPASVTFPQILAPFEKPGAGDLAFLAKGNRVRFESVDDETGTVVSVDYKGRIEKWNPQGRSLRVELGGEVRGPAATKYKPLSPIPWRHDMGRLAHRMLNNLGVKARPRRPETGYVLGEPGGGYMLGLLEEMFAQSWTLDGDQWTCMPDANGIYRTSLKDLDTCDFTVYPDDSRVVVDLASDVAEEPNRIFGTGTNPDGMRINNAIFGGAIEPTKAPTFPGVMSENSWGSDGLDVLLHKLRTQRYLNANDFPGGFDDDVVEAVKELQEDAGLPQSGIVDINTWRALWDIGVTGRSVRGTRIEPLAQKGYTREWFHSAGGAFTGKNPNYDPNRQVVDVHYDFGAKQRRNQMVRRAKAVLQGTEEQWTGTITINTGAVVAGDHTPGAAISSVMRANQIKPGMNCKVPSLLGDRLLHVSGVSVTGRTVQLVVDTKGRDTMAAFQAWQNNVESRRDPARAWLREYRSSNQIKDTIGEFSENGGILDRKQILTPNDWTIFEVFTGPIEGQIKWLRLNCGPNVEFSVLVFGMKMNLARLRNLIPNPLSKAGEARFRDRDIRRKLKERVLLYSAGIEDEPCGYWPDKKTEGASFITGKWEDDMSWPYRTIPPLTSEIYSAGETPKPQPLNRFPEPVLYVCVYANARGYVRPGRIMWPQAEGGV